LRSLHYDTKKINELLLRLEEIQEYFKEKFDATDIISGSKFYEIIIANELNHEIIPGQAGTKDAKDKNGEYEYKHFKESSSNHSWTFNDYSDATIASLKNIYSAIFAHIDTKFYPPKFDWYIEVDGKTCSDYLKVRTETLLKDKPKGKVNARKMINFSANQLEQDLKLEKTYLRKPNKDGIYYEKISEISNIAKELEAVTDIDQILTGDKIWELLVAIKLNHEVFSEQKKHDAKDDAGNLYEYKIAQTHSWNFQDISDKVLKKYEDDRAIILAIVDKQKLKVKEIHSAEPSNTISRLKEKLDDRKRKLKEGKTLRRLSVSLSKGDLEKINARKIFP